MKAIWKDVVIAESNETIVVEGNHYFSLKDVNNTFLSKTDTHTTCPWKGEAHYYSITVAGETLKDAGWYYPEPKDKAKNIANYVAFWKGVSVNS